MFARLAGACVIPVSFGLFLLGDATLVRPQANAAPVAQLGALADQLTDVIAVATRGRTVSTSSRSAGSSRSFSSGRSFSGRSSSSGRSFSHSTRTFSGTRAVHRTRHISATRPLHTTRTITRTRSVRGIGAISHPTGLRTLSGHKGSRTFTGHTTGTRLISGTRGPGGPHATGGHTLKAGPGHVRGPGSITRGPGVGAAHLMRGPGHGPGRLAGFARIHNRHVHIFRDRRWTWWGGSWRVWAPITALAGIYIGSSYLWPDAYVSVAQPACVGVTDDGCTLHWQSVPFEEGGADMQCVQFCPRVGVAPPPVPATGAAQPLPPLPAVAPVPAAGLCELTIFSDRNFAGMSAPTTEDQPRLAEVGWKNEIASLQIKGGTWDFFSDDDFSGESMRLPAGQYDNLGDKWTKRIGSFTCVQ